MSLSEAANIFVKFGPREFPLIDLIEAWASRVLRFLDESNASDDADGAGGANDLIGAYHLRAALDVSMTAADAISDFAVVEVTDQLLRSFSRPEPLAHVQLIDGDVHTGEWWWTLIPTRGPVRREFDELVKEAAEG